VHNCALYDVSLTAKSRFDAATVVALKMHHGAQRLEIKFADEAGTEHVVSLPTPAAMELAKFISDAARFMRRLKKRPRSSSST
jgi:hypothetical protein